MEKLKAAEDTLTDHWTTIEELEKKTKRLVAISLRPDFVKAFPWDGPATATASPEDARARAKQNAAKIRATQEQKANAKKP